MRMSYFLYKIKCNSVHKSSWGFVLMALTLDLYTIPVILILCIFYLFYVYMKYFIPLIEPQIEFV